jgi:hypothetical protein
VDAVLGVQLRRDAKRVLAADRHERVELLALDRREHLLDAAVELVRVRARGADDRAAARKDPRDLPRAERLGETVDQALPALADADDVPAGLEQPSRRRANDRVKAWAVAAAGEHACAHGSILETALH